MKITRIASKTFEHFLDAEKWMEISLTVGLFCKRTFDVVDGEPHWRVEVFEQEEKTKGSGSGWLDWVRKGQPGI